MPNKITELREDRAKLFTDARSLVDKAEGENRDLTEEESTNYDKMLVDAKKLEGRAKRQETLDTEKRRQAEVDARNKDLNPSGTSPGTEERSQSDLQLDGFSSLVRFGRAESLERDEDAVRSFQSFSSERQKLIRNLTLGGGGESGGWLVLPEALYNGLVKDLDNEVFIRQFATIQTMPQAVSLGVPTLEQDPDDFEFTEELGTGREDEGTRFGKRNFEPNPVAKRARISETLIQRSSMPVEQILRDRLYYKLGITLEKAYMTGDGNRKPLGLFTEHADGISSARNVSAGNSATGIGTDGLINAKYALTAAYRREASWIFHRDALSMVSKLKDNENRYLWRVSERDGDPDTLLGHAYRETEYAPSTFTTGLTVGMIGNLRYYWVVDVSTTVVKRLLELYAETNQIGLIIRMETDGMPVRERAFARVTLA